MADTDRQAAMKSHRRIEELISALDTHPDQQAAGMARELVATVLDLHGAGLSRLMDVLASTGAGKAIIGQLLEEEHVRALVLLHDLHPEPLEARIADKVERLRPHLGVLGLRPEITEIADGTVHIRMYRRNGAAIEPSVLFTLPEEIEEAIIDIAPEIGKVVIGGLDTIDDAAVAQGAK